MGTLRQPRFARTSIVLGVVAMVPFWLFSRSPVPADAPRAPFVGGNCPARAESRWVGGRWLVTWHLDRRPTLDHCELKVALSPDAWAAGPATVIDAAGARWSVPAEPELGAFAWRLGSHVLSAARFPLTVDPSVSPRVLASVARSVSQGSNASVASNGMGWLAATCVPLASEVHLTELDAMGQVVGRAALVDGECYQQLVFTDRYVLVGDFSFRLGNSLAELVDAGASALPAPGFWSVTGADRSGALLIRHEALLDGGTETTVRPVGADFSSDGGQVVFPGYIGSVAVEGSTTYVVGSSLWLASRNGQPLSELTRADGGPWSGVLGTNGSDATLLYFFDATSVMGAIYRAGVPTTPEFIIAGPLQLLEGAMEHNGGGRIVYLPVDSGTVFERLVSSSGLLGPEVPLVGVPTNPRYRAVFDLIGGARGSLMLWFDSGPGESALRFGYRAPGSTAFDGGGVLFLGPNHSTHPSIAARGSELFVAWSDDRNGSSFLEPWARRVDGSLQVLEADAFPAGGLGRGEPAFGFLNSTGRNVVPSPEGFDAVYLFNNDRRLELFRLDLQGRPRAPPVALVPEGFRVPLFPSAYATSHGTLALAVPSLLSLDFWLIDSLGQVIQGVLGPTSDGAHGAVETGDGVLVFFGGQVSKIRWDDGGTEAVPLLSNPEPYQSVVGTEPGRALALVFYADAGRLEALDISLDGGSRSSVELLSDPTAVSARSELAWDGRRAYAYVLRWDSANKSTRTFHLRLPDAGWLSASGPPSPNRFGSSVTPLPNEGIAVAEATPRGIEVYRVAWRDLGQSCGGNDECESGFCVDAVCCNSACGGGAADCVACSRTAGATSDGVCATARAGSLCRPKAGVCDAEEFCDGTSTLCAADLLKGAEVVCRPSEAVCDVAESCTGTSAACPVNGFADAGAVCSAPSGCLAQGLCTGASAACFADRLDTPECLPGASPQSLRVGCGCAAGNWAETAALLSLALTLRRRWRLMSTGARPASAPPGQRGHRC